MCPRSSLRPRPAFGKSTCKQVLVMFSNITFLRKPSSQFINCAQSVTVVVRVLPFFKSLSLFFVVTLFHLSSVVSLSFSRTNLSLSVSQGDVSWPSGTGHNRTTFTSLVTRVFQLRLPQDRDSGQNLPAKPARFLALRNRKDPNCLGYSLA